MSPPLLPQDITMTSETEETVLDLLGELVAIVRGECPSLLSEDSGGSAELSLRIDAALSRAPGAEEPSEMGQFVGDIFFGDPTNSTRGTHRWTGTEWVPLPTDVEVLTEMLAEARAQIAALSPGGEGEVDEADIPSLLERAGRGERLTSAEQTACAGYELGWRDGRKDAAGLLVAALEPFADACEGCDEGTVDDHTAAWESPLAMAVTYGDFRRAAATLTKLKENGLSREELGGLARNGGETCAATPESAATIAPEGWVLVPRTPTEEMMAAGLYQASHDAEYADVYSSWVDMVDAASPSDGSVA